MRRGSLAEERPELLAQWARSNPISPSEVSCGSHKKVLWVCKNGHTWEATVKNRALIGSGCPYCEHRAVLKGYNDLLTAFPDIAKTWSPKNLKKPSEVSSKSNADVLWICENGHEWRARIADRTDGHGCPYCAGQRVWKGFNDLATTHPHLAAEWSDKNKFTPESITYKNRSNVWWHCGNCGCDYQAVVYARANGRMCPFCVARELKRLRDIIIVKKKVEKDFSYLLPQLTTIFYAGNHELKVISDSEQPIGIPVTAYIPEINLVIDICNSAIVIRVKEHICSIYNIKYINIPEKLPELETVSRVRAAFTGAHIHLNSDPAKDLEIIRKRYSQYRKK